MAHKSPDSSLKVTLTLNHDSKHLFAEFIYLFSSGIRWADFCGGGKGHPALRLQRLEWRGEFLLGRSFTLMGACEGCVLCNKLLCIKFYFYLSIWMTPDCYAVSLSMIQRFGVTQLHTLLNLIQVQSYGDVLHPHVREGKKNDRDSVPLSWSSAQVCIVACAICFERDVSHVWKFGENTRICSPSSQIRPCMSSLFLAEGTFGPIIKLRKKDF